MAGQSRLDKIHLGVPTVLHGVLALDPMGSLTDLGYEISRGQRGFMVYLVVTDSLPQDVRYKSRHGFCPSSTRPLRSRQSELSHSPRRVRENGIERLVEVRVGLADTCRVRCSTALYFIKQIVLVLCCSRSLGVRTLVSWCPGATDYRYSTHRT